MTASAIERCDGATLAATPRQRGSFDFQEQFLPFRRALHLDDLVELGESFSTTQQVRIFAGYAGWSPGQLDEELKRDAWLTHPSSIDLVFNTKPDDLWQMILRQKGWKYRLLSQTPEDLSWN